MPTVRAEGVAQTQVARQLLLVLVGEPRVLELRRVLWPQVFPAPCLDAKNRKIQATKVVGALAATPKTSTLACLDPSLLNLVHRGTGTPPRAVLHSQDSSIEVLDKEPRDIVLVITQTVILLQPYPKKNPEQLERPQNPKHPKPRSSPNPRP